MKKIILFKILPVSLFILSGMMLNFDSNASHNDVTNYKFTNQTNVLVQYMYGECAPSAAGNIYPSESVTLQVKDGEQTKVSFRASYGASYCHCYAHIMKTAASEQTIMLNSKSFCDR